MKKIFLVAALVLVFAADVLVRQFGNASAAQGGVSSVVQTPPSVSSPIAQASPSGSQSQTQTQTQTQTRKNTQSQTQTGSSSQGASSGQKSQGMYKDGTYTGSVADAYYGNVQVQVMVQGGKIADVQFLQYPNTHSTSVMINSQAMPYLKSEALQVQSANVNIVSGATETSLAFQQSLADALTQARV